MISDLVVKLVILVGDGVHSNRISMVTVYNHLRNHYHHGNHKICGIHGESILYLTSWLKYIDIYDRYIYIYIYDLAVHT